MLRVTAVWDLGPGTPYYSTFYFGGTTAGEATAAHSAVTDYMQAMDAFLVNLVAGDVVSDVELVDPSTGQITGVFTETATAFAGAISGDPLPWAAQLLVRWRTGVFVNGREIRGRTFFPGVPETTVTGGVVVGSAITAFNSAAQAFVTSADSTAAGDFVVYSPTNLQHADVSAWSTWDQLAVLRSRRP